MGDRLSLPSLELLYNKYTYCPESGLLVYNNDSGFGWNKKLAGEQVGSNHRGYLRVGFQGKNYLVHRLCWYMYHQEEPEVIDHIDGNTLNNKISNLRSVTHQVNSINREFPEYPGVYWEADRQRYRVQYRKDGKLYNVGRYETKEQAELVSKLAREEAWGGLYNRR